MEPTEEEAKAILTVDQAAEWAGLAGPASEATSPRSLAECDRSLPVAPAAVAPQPETGTLGADDALSLESPTVSTDEEEGIRESATANDEEAIGRSTPACAPQSASSRSSPLPLALLPLARAARPTGPARAPRYGASLLGGLGWAGSVAPSRPKAPSGPSPAAALLGWHAGAAPRPARADPPRWARPASSLDEHVQRVTAAAAKAEQTTVDDFVTDALAVMMNRSPRCRGRRPQQGPRRASLCTCPVAPTQPCWGATKRASAARPGPIFASVHTEAGAVRDAAANCLIEAAHLLENRNFALGVRGFAPDEHALRALLRPRKPGSVPRHWRMRLRYQAFAESAGALDPDSFSVPKTVLGWFLDLMAKAAGRCTLLAGPNCFKFLGHVFQFEGNTSDGTVLKRVASDWDTRAAETKTFPRHRSCSGLSCTPDGDGRLEATMELRVLAHGDRLSTDDHPGKRALTDRSGWDTGPPDGHSDAALIRIRMLEGTGIVKGRQGFTDVEAAEHRNHGAKATLTGVGVHLEVGRQAVRHQGGWKGPAGNLMPDIYLRTTQRLVPGLQERVIDFLHAGGEVFPLGSEYLVVPAAPAAPNPRLTFAQSYIWWTLGPAYWTPSPQEEPTKGAPAEDVLSASDTSGGDSGEVEPPPFLAPGTDTLLVSYHLAHLSVEPEGSCVPAGDSIAAPICGRCFFNAEALGWKKGDPQVMGLTACESCFGRSSECIHACLLDDGRACRRRCANSPDDSEWSRSRTATRCTAACSTPASRTAPSCSPCGTRSPSQRSSRRCSTRLSPRSRPGRTARWPGAPPWTRPWRR